MTGRGKGKGAPVFDFIALGGNKGGGSSKRDSPGGSGSSSSGQLIQSTSGSNILSKKSGGGSKGLQSTASKKSDRYLQWEEIAKDVNPLDLVDLIERSGDSEMSEAYLCGAVKALRKERAKPDQILWLSLMYLAKSEPKLFLSGYVREALCSLLKRDPKESFKSKGNSIVPVSAVSLLMAAYQDEKHWPEIFVRVYMDDAIGDRVWVDHPDAKIFVDNILTAFNTIIPPQVRGGGSGGEGGSFGACPSPGAPGSSGSRTPTRGDEEIQIIDLPINTEPDLDGSTGVLPRYTQQQDYIEAMVLNTVREKFNTRQGADNITKNFLRFLAFACGLQELRHLVIGKLEMWLINQKISRPAQDLLLSITHNCNTHSQMDVEVMSSLSKLRLKTKPNINMFLSSLRDLCTAHPDNLPTMMKQTIFNELSNARNTNNMPMLAVIFQTDPDKAAASLANVFMELLLQKDCYLRALRLLLREITRCLRYDISINVFCLNLMIDSRDKFEQFKEFEFKERAFVSIVDLITLSIFLGISPAVREAYNAYSRQEKKDLTAYKIYLQNVCTIQKNGSWWMFEVVPKLYKPDGLVYTNQLYKLLFMAPNLEEYYRMDNWPAEPERSFFFKVTSEIPVHEESILRMFLIGLHKNLPLNGQDCLAIAETMIKKAAGLHPLVDEDFPILYSDKAKQFMECVWELTAYTYPESIALPHDYKPPSMAITASYWKAWQLLLIMSAHNPLHFGALAWESYPTLRALMEMCITSQFVFPPSTLAATTEKLEDVRIQERQLAEIEKQEILEFESRLAAASSKQVITEKSSLLLSTITRMDPLGHFRCPPPAVLEQLKQMNTHYKLGHLLCRSRQPDFLLDILQRQGTNQAMPWLADLVESNEGSLSVLPVQCLCEFLLNDSLPLVESGKVTKKRKAGELLKHLQTILQHPETDAASCLETLDYFLRRLASLQSQSRVQALNGLKMLVTPSVDDDLMETDEVDSSGSAWLLEHIPALPCFQLAYQSIAGALRQACENETDPATVSLYIRFLSQTCPVASLPDLADLALELANVIVERSILLPAILPGSSHIASIGTEDQQLTFQALLHVFNRYMLLVRQENNDLAWTGSQALLNVVWATQESATLHILVVHAQIILLTYGSAHGNSELFNTLLLMWFPPGQELPRAYLVPGEASGNSASVSNTSLGEEALLIPDWLKLKMIRSSVSVLVDSALRDLEPHQLVLFIQSFGIPVESMSKLLHTLDQAVKADLKSVSDSVLDKNYMGQLVAVQHRRGASGGLVFAKSLGLNLDLGGLKLGGSGGHSHQHAMKSPLPTVHIPPRSTAMIPPSQVKSTILQVLEIGSACRMTGKEQADTFRTLQKLLTQELSSTVPSKPILEATIQALNSLTKSELCDPLIHALQHRSSYACSLFRILTTALTRGAVPLSPNSALAATLFNTLHFINIRFQQKQIECPLSSLLQQFLVTYKASKESESKSFNKEDRSQMNNKEQRSVLDVSSETMEADLKKLALDALRRGSSENLVTSLAELLIQDEGPPGGKGEKGLALDWLELLDPGTLAGLPQLQAQLMFAKGLTTKGMKKDGERKVENTGKKGMRACRPYLLSLLTHQGSYSVLQSTVSTVLSVFKPDLEPTAVLDFLTACIHIPRLWQGRQQNSGKNSRPEDVLDLSDNSIKVLGEYVLAEAKESGDGNCVESRIPLILQCIQDKETKSTALVQQIILQAEDKETTENAKHLLLLLYMKLPSLLAGRLTATPSNQSLAVVSSCGRNTSCVDLVSYTLFTTLANTQPGRDWGLKMQDFETSARKLMSCHPDLTLRNLPLLVAGLQGRTQLEYHLFRIQNHLSLFTICLGLLELARPQVFAAEHSHHLETALSCYIHMCSAYFQRRESFFGLIDRFVNFLNSWLSAGGQTASRAAKFLSTHSEVLISLSSAHGTDRMLSLKYLMSYSFSGTEHTSKAENLKPCDSISQSDAQDIKIESEKDSISLEISSSGSTVVHRLDKDVEMLRTRITTADSDDTLANTIQDLLKASLPRPDLLVHFQDILTGHIHHDKDSIRTLAYVCLLRMLRQSPKIWRAILPEYIAALQCEDQGVLDSALKNLADLTVICQEEADMLLTTVFRLGLYGGRVSVATPLSETINQLNSQLGR